MKKACLFLPLLLLAACAGDPDFLVAKSPAMVTLCAKSNDIQTTLSAAQEHCEHYNKSAELIASAPFTLDTNQACKREDDPLPGRIVHFRCVRD